MGAYRITLIVVFSLGITTSSVAQNLNLLSASRDANGRRQDDRTQVAVPAGVMSAIDKTTAESGIAPVIGFQVWKKDEHFLGVFFTYSPVDTISGDQRKFGSILLNPPAKGTSFFASANRNISRLNFGSVRTNLAGRIGVTNTKWQFTPAGGTAEAREGFVFYLTPGVQFTSQTYLAGDGDNEYQFGIELGYGFRAIGGDLAQDNAFRQQLTVLASGESSFHGLELTLFARLNSFQPFVRISSYSKVAGLTAGTDADIRGLTGWQSFFGVDVLSAIFKTSAE